MAFAVLLALCWQSFIVETHLHFEPRLVSAAAVQVSAGQQLASAKAPSHTPANCPICREFASAGHYLQPGFVGLDQPIATWIWLLPPALPMWNRQPRSHAWRSRGPPIRLQA